MRGDEREHHDLPPRKSEETVRQKIKQGIQQGNLPKRRGKSAAMADVMEMKAVYETGRHFTATAASVCKKKGFLRCSAHCREKTRRGATSRRSRPSDALF
jgi:hypothetical protein